METAEDIRRSDREDLAWMKGVKKGNRRVFEKLVLKYQKRIYYTVRKIVLNHDDADDVVQETFVKVFTHLDSFDESCPFYPWLQKIAVNTALNHLSRVKRRKEISIDSGGALYLNGSDEGDGPMERVFYNELKKDLERALNALPAEQRAVFVLRNSEELGYAEIAERLDISPGTVMSRLSRAREKLKILLKPYLAENDAGSEPHGM